MSEDHLEHLRRKAAIWLPLMDGNPDSVRLLRQMIEEDLDGMPAVCLMAVKMVTGALSEGGQAARLAKHSLKREHDRLVEP
jgi:hypothetical protein